MSEKIVTTISSTQYIEWDAPADCLLFWAWLSGFEQFQALHQQVTGGAATPAQYELLRSPDNAKRFKEIA